MKRLINKKNNEVQEKQNKAEELLPILTMKKKDIEKLPEYQEGIRWALGLRGIYDTFTNKEMSQEDALALVMHMITAETTIKVAEIQGNNVWYDFENLNT